MDNFVRDGSDEFTLDRKHSVQMIINFNGIPFFAPAYNDYTVLKVMQKRLLNSPSLSNSAQSYVFKNMNFQFPFLENITWSKELCEEWIDSIDCSRRRKRAQKTFEKYLHGEVLFEDKQLVESIVKNDEKFLTEFCGREIRFVPSHVAVLTCPIYVKLSKLFSHFLKINLFHGCVVEFAHGYKSRDLNLWMKRVLLNPCHGFIVLGDDILLKYQRNNIIKWIECDFSTYDITQGKSVLKQCYKLAKVMGVDPKIIDFLYQVHTRKVKIYGKGRKHNMIVDRHNFITRDSGGPNTCFDNSIANILSWLYVLHRDIKIEDFSQFFATQIGFVAKIKVFDTPVEGTFLKGKWWVVDNPINPLVFINGMLIPDSDNFQLIYGPLPGKMLKTVCSLRPVTDIVPKSLSSSLQFCNYAALSFLKGQARNLQTQTQVPIIEAFVNRFAQLATVESFISEKGFMDFSNDTHRYIPSRVRALEDVSARYSLSVEEILFLEEVLSMCEEFSILPGSWEKLLIDYS
jgi:hypothetical protein